MNKKEEIEMKRFNWLLIGSVVLCLALVLLAGCGIPQADYDELNTEHTALQADYDELDAEYTTLQADYEAVQNELAEIKEAYPPEDFPSLTVLNDWLLGNDLSEKPDTTYGEDWYGRALEVQEDALRGGYIVSADYDYDAEEETYSVWCTTVINGRVFFWDPETDDVFEDTVIGIVK